MELKDFIDKFADQFDETDASEIDQDCVFQELEEWDSLTILSIIAFIKINYQLDINGQEIRSCETVKDLFDLIVSKKN